MAAHELTFRLKSLGLRELRRCPRQSHSLQRRCLSQTAPQAVPTDKEYSGDVEPASSLETAAPGDDVLQSFNPIARSRARKTQLPPSRYQYRSPKYYRGPLHPHQPPPPSDPSSRLFVPGPFSLPRLQQTYESTIEPDLMTLSYTHIPPGFKPPPKSPRLRAWDDSSPYHKNRPLRGPRGAEVLRLLRYPINFRNVPKLTGVTVHTMVKGALADSAYLHVGGMAMQAITGKRVTTFKSRTGMQEWGLRAGKYISMTAELKGEDMYNFLSKCIDIVLPKIKDWRGVKGTSGDSSGNITFGLDSEAVGLFPEIEVNYDMYPPKMIPGCHVTVQTSATNDRDARMLLSAIGFPFYGKLVN